MPIRLTKDYLAWKAGHVFLEGIPASDVRKLWVLNGIAEYVKIIRDDKANADACKAS